MLDQEELEIPQPHGGGVAEGQGQPLEGLHAEAPPDAVEPPAALQERVDFAWVNPGPGAVSCVEGPLPRRWLRQQLHPCGGRRQSVIAVRTPIGQPCRGLLLLLLRRGRLWLHNCPSCGPPSPLVAVGRLQAVQCAVLEGNHPGGAGLPAEERLAVRVVGACDGSRLAEVEAGRRGVGHEGEAFLVKRATQVAPTQEFHLRRDGPVAQHPPSGAKRAATPQARLRGRSGEPGGRVREGGHHGRQRGRRRLWLLEVQDCAGKSCRLFNSALCC
mmetsp:Transcript_123234/g.343069  ORF Transcript_123234/g.343069 Transcript_123234/m.343069 type:complete len:272 (+) Transcript_123234:384-1199(+)